MKKVKVLVLAREILGCGSIVVPGDDTNATYLTNVFRKNGVDV